MKKAWILLLIACLALGAVACGSGSGEDNGTVRVYSYGDYIDPAVVDAFEEATGITVILDTYDTAEELYPVLANNSVNYDVICTSDYMVERLMNEDLLAEIDYANVPKVENLDPIYLENTASFDPDHRHAVPHTWGTLGILYNTKNIPEGSITSWNDLWKKEYSGQIVMPDSMRDTMAIALKAKGYSLNTMDEAQLAEASDYLIEQKPLVYKNANDSARDMLIGESADIGVVWSGEVLYSQEENPDLAFVVPVEGSEMFTDLWAIPADAENKANGEAWINFMLDQATALTNFEYLTYTIPNVSVQEAVADDPEKQAILFPEASLLSNCEVLRSLGAEGDDLYSKYWKAFKS